MVRRASLLLLLAACSAEPGGLGETLRPLEDSPDVELPPAPPACADVEGELPAVEGGFIAQGQPFVGVRSQCRAALHPFAGARGSTLEVVLERWNSDVPARVSVEGLLGEIEAGPVELLPNEALAVRLERAGEHFVRLVPSQRDAATNTYRVRITCVERCRRPYTRYPIVLLHGAAPGEYFGLVDYFDGVAEHLTDAGYLVMTPVVEPWLPTPQRAAQVQAALDAYVQAGLGRRFNLIGHSQGGLDARYVASRLDTEGRVASVTTVATPHHGTPVADVLTGAIELSPLDGFVFDAFVDAVAWLLGAGDQDPAATAAFMTTESMAQFNAEVPDVPGVHYASWAGVTCGPLDGGCQDANNGEVVAAYLLPTFLLVDALAGPNDGLVPVDSSVWGNYLGELPADHMDQVGQIVDLSDGPFAHLDFFASEAERLAALGL